MTGLAYRLGHLRIIWHGPGTEGRPERGPGPRPVRRDEDGMEIRGEGESRPAT